MVAERPTARSIDKDIPRGKDAVRVGVVVQGQRKLLQIVFALGAPCRFARLLDGRQEKGNQRGDDGDDDEQFNERKSALSQTSVPTVHDSCLPRGKRKITRSALHSELIQGHVLDHVVFERLRFQERSAPTY